MELEKKAFSTVLNASRRVVGKAQAKIADTGVDDRANKDDADDVDDADEDDVGENDEQAELDTEPVRLTDSHFRSDIARVLVCDEKSLIVRLPSRSYATSNECVCRWCRRGRESLLQRFSFWSPQTS